MGIVSFHNHPRLIAGSGRDLVSWPTRGTSDASMHEFGTLDQYLAWVRDGAFTCLLSDFSLIRASYECMGSATIGHSLLYWPCPIDFREGLEDLDELCDGIAMCIESVHRSREICSLTMRAPMRFDFDPSRESDDHPLVHLHTQFEDARISVQQAMCFPGFMKRVLRTFYRNRWQLSEIDSIHEPGLRHQDGQCEPPTRCFQITWS